MPAVRGRDRTLIEDALAALCAALSETRAPWMVIGGIAAIAHGVQRMTTDIDVVIRGDSIQLPALLSALGRHEIEPRMSQAEAFAAENLVLLVRHSATQVDLDLSFGWTAFECDAIASRVNARYGAISAPMTRVEELIVFKAIAARPRDVDDIQTLLTLYPRIDLSEVRQRVTVLAVLAEAPELLAGLDAILRAPRASRRSAKVALSPIQKQHRTTKKKLSKKHTSVKARKKR
ncbi:MAG TPA: DUF6036 family nucleotidyltransferase [Polyangiaceae bacterium]